MATFAEILHLAADKYLDSASFANIEERLHMRYTHSCNAINAAHGDMAGYPTPWKFDSECRAWYETNFLEPGQAPYIFDRLGENAQAVRYANLKFAALIAEEEGL